MADPIDYTTQLNAVNSKLDGITAQLNQMISGENDTHIVFSNLMDMLDTINTTIQNKTIVTGSIDYTASIANLSKLLAWTDILLIVVLVLLLLIGGIILGGQITKWMKMK